MSDGITDSYKNAASLSWKGAGKPSQYTIKDSGERAKFESGMVRDTTIGKIQYGRVLDGPMFKRWAEHLTKGAVKYPDVASGKPNWMLAEGEEEYNRFRDSALRHFIAWWNGEVDEDHAAGVFFNVNGAEYVKGKTGGPYASSPLRNMANIGGAPAHGLRNRS